MYHIEISSSVKKDLKKLSFEVREKIINEILPFLALDPYEGEILQGEFRRFWRFKFKHKKTEYRIVYEIFEEELIVLLIIIGTRENFYKKLKRRVK
ncbi:MAG: type II toxin-antitoxin system mRNA interferase toxin, RelE/StbE family [bacterium]